MKKREHLNYKFIVSRHSLFHYFNLKLRYPFLTAIMTSCYFIYFQSSY